MQEKKTTVFQDFVSGDISGEGLKAYQKYVSETASIYLNEAAAKNSKELAYEVLTDDHSEITDDSDVLNWGVTSMYPVLIDGECCMTRGHFHMNRSHPEYYLCTAGEGHLLCWDGKDEVVAYHMVPGSLQYIEGRMAHRLINTGNEVFKVAACWARKAGHNYEAIEESGFPIRAFKRDGKLVWEKQ